MPQSTSVITMAFVLGTVLLLIAVVGGKFKIFGAEISGTVGSAGRLVAGLAGLALITIGLISALRQNSFTPPPTPRNGDLRVCYQDKEPDTSVHNIRFLELTARCIRNPPRVNDRISIAFTIQNAGNKPVEILETWVTAYDPNDEQKDFGHSNKKKILMPQETIKTSGSLIVDVPGIWEFGPHYALGEKWDGEQYPGHWKRFPLSVQ